MKSLHITGLIAVFFEVVFTVSRIRKSSVSLQVLKCYSLKNSINIFKIRQCIVFITRDSQNKKICYNTAGLFYFISAFLKFVLLCTGLTIRVPVHSTEHSCSDSFFARFF